MIAVRERFIQFNFLHRAYYTPQRLSRIYPQRVPNCQRCKQEIGTFWHMIWSCPKIQPYWEAVASKLTDVIGTDIQVGPSILLLSYLENVDVERYSKLCLMFSLYYARWEIMLKWKSETSPNCASWQCSVNLVLPLYRSTYESRLCPGKFDKIWSTWLDTCSDPEPPPV